jgi:hypothetical protein
VVEFPHGHRETQDRCFRHRRGRSLARPAAVRRNPERGIRPKFGSSGICKHAANQPHAKGEWIGAEIRLETPLLAQYAVSHYLEQDRVLDADVVE